MRRNLSSDAGVRKGEHSQTRPDAAPIAANASIASSSGSEAAGVVLRKPRHGGWKDAKPHREAAMLQGEPGHCIGLFRVGYGLLLVHHTLVFMTSGAIDASFPGSDAGPHPPDSSPQDGGEGGAMVNFGYGSIGGPAFGPPGAEAVRSACWCLCAAGAAISAGLRPNAVAFASALLQMYLLLLEKSLYTDGAYLFTLMAFLLSVTDCGKTIGVDTMGKEGAEDASSRSARGQQPQDSVPHWHVVLLRFQICILHVHRALAKASTAGWVLEGQPLLGALLSMPSDRLLRQLADWAASSDISWLGGGGLQALAMRVSASMIFLDLFLGISLLCAPHYRPAAVVIQTLLHLTQGFLGGRDVRPWHLLIALSGVLFLDPGWVQGLLESFRAWLNPAGFHNLEGHSRTGSKGAARAGRRPGAGGRRAPGVVSKAASASPACGTEETATSKPKKLRFHPRPSPAATALVCLYVLLQIALPLRHLILAHFPVEWGREGHEFSWREGGGSGKRGNLVEEDALVRIIHTPRKPGRKGASSQDVMNVHLYGAPLSAQQVRRLVVDPDMILQLTKKSAESMTAGQGRGARSAGRTPPYSHVDGWKSVNGRPFTPWLRSSVDVWDVELDDGIGLAEWLHSPPSDAALDSTTIAMESLRVFWAKRKQKVTFFMARPGQALSNVYLGGYDPSNLNTLEMCSVPSPPRTTGEEESGGGDGDAGVRGAEGGVRGVEGGGILLGLVKGEVALLTDPGNGETEPVVRSLFPSNGTILAPVGEAHSIHVASPRRSNPDSRMTRGEEDAIALWYYVHACPHGLFHLSIGYLSGAGWEQLYSPYAGTRKGWLMEHGIARRY